MASKPSEQAADAIIIGAGAIGLSAAVHLARSGLYVQVLDRNRPGQEASWAGGGILSPLHPWRYTGPLLKLAQEGMLVYQPFTAGLHESTGIDPEWQRSGMWVLGTADAPLPDHAVDWGARWNWCWEWTDRTEFVRHAPDLRTDGDALFCPDVAQVRNPRLLSALERSCEILGVSLHSGEEVMQLRRLPGPKLLVRSRNGSWTAPNVILATGAWSGQFLSGALGISLPVHPVLGQMVLLQGEPGRLAHIVLEGERYLVQRRDGKILVGSTSEERGFDKSVTQEAATGLLQFAHRVFPPSKKYPVLRQWSGLRPGSPGNIPFIGPVPGWEGLYAATGHFRYGLTTAPVTAAILDALVTGTPPPLDITPYTVALPSG